MKDENQSALSVALKHQIKLDLDDPQVINLLNENEAVEIAVAAINQLIIQLGSDVPDYDGIILNLGLLRMVSAITPELYTEGLDGLATLIREKGVRDNASQRQDDNS